MLSEWQTMMSRHAAGEQPQQSRKETSSLVITSSKPEYKTNLPLQKRSRALADVDGDNSDTRQRKKRRLRRDLITSRLSRPYATPATHIISRNAVRLGIWTGRRYIGRNAFRKAAILNSIRREKLHSVTEKKITMTHETTFKTTYERLNPDIGSVRIKSIHERAEDVVPKHQAISNRINIPEPPISRVATNYDVFDEEDSDPDADDTLSANVFDSVDAESDESDDLSPFDEISIASVGDSPSKDNAVWELFSSPNRPPDTSTKGGYGPS